MRKPFVLALLLAPALVVRAQHSNILISSSNAPQEPSIQVNPKNPRYVVAGANLRSAYYSADTGRTWTRQTLSSSYSVWGDPVILCDTAGAFHYFHLTNSSLGLGDRIVAQRSTDGGRTWSDGTFFGFNLPKMQDKEWAVVDRRNNHLYVTWTQFDRYASIDPADSSHILFTRSTDGGNTWSPARRLDTQGGDCRDDDGTVEGAMPAAGPNGEVYVAWAGPQGIRFNRSLDGGNTWLAQDKPVTGMPGGWAFDIPGISRCNGLPVIKCDVSNGPGRGTIYISWTDQRNGPDDTDVWLVASSDGGTTWSAPVRVNDDSAGKQQFFSWMDLDTKSGHLYFVFYDRRNYTDVRTDVYMARSVDRGVTFENFLVSERPFAPQASVFFGDYCNLSVHGDIIRPVWTRMDNGALSVWTALVDTARINGRVPVPPADVELNTYPNPFTNYSYLSFGSRVPAVVTVAIYDLQGRHVATPLRDAHYHAGKHTVYIDAGAHHLAPGTYTYSVTINGVHRARKMIRLQ